MCFGDLGITVYYALPIADSHLTGIVRCLKLINDSPSSATRVALAFWNKGEETMVFVTLLIQ